ncbi:MAG: archaeosortase/exosortase family protein [Verrucomicrobiota bacterium]|nr:archaeosortase/exosortase family protein [Verrucomicrobiota bacterium]
MKDEFIVLGVEHSGCVHTIRQSGRGFVVTHGAALAFVLIAHWAVWRWYALRLSDGSDEPFGVVALVATFVLCQWKQLRLPMSDSRLVLLGICISAYALSQWTLPPIFRAALGMGAVAVCIVRGSSRWGIGMLLGLSLPWLATMQFYLGYPLRLVTALFVVPLLQLSGQPVAREGVTLWFAGDPVVIDAPCSGVHMLWMGLFAAAIKVALASVTLPSTLRHLRWTGFCIFSANLVRNYVLFFVETKQWPLPPWGHETVGLLCFAIAVIAIVVMPLRLNQTSYGALPHWTGAIYQSVLRRFRRSMSLIGSYRQGLVVSGFLLVIVAASLHPLMKSFSGEPAESKSLSFAPISIASLKLPEGNWTPLPLTAVDARWAATFPGEVLLYGDGEGRLIVRRVEVLTRRLHPAEDCFRGMGFKIADRRLIREGISSWATFTATKVNTTYSVRERIQDTSGNSWTDVSAWFWHAMLGKSTGPWLSLVQVAISFEPLAEGQ